MPKIMIQPRNGTIWRQCEDCHDTFGPFRTIQAARDASTVCPECEENRKNLADYLAKKKARMVNVVN